MTDLRKKIAPARVSKARQRRQRRAAQTRAHALSPLRILLLLISFPFLTASVAFGVYIRTSPYPSTQALQHIVALAGCDAAARVGVFNVAEGMPGYHARNDPDGNGIACEPEGRRAEQQQTDQPVQPERRQIGNARFVKP